MKNDKTSVFLSARGLSALEAECLAEKQDMAKGLAVLRHSRGLEKQLSCTELIKLGRMFDDPHLFAGSALLQWQNACRQRLGL